jgi:hypothetical protein
MNINSNTAATPTPKLELTSDSPTPSAFPQVDYTLGIAVLMCVVSLFTSVSSLLGFISTTILAWRKEKRETKTFDTDNERRKLELEKLKFELAKVQEEKLIESPQSIVTAFLYYPC